MRAAPTKESAYEDRQRQPATERWRTRLDAAHAPGEVRHMMTATAGPGGTPGSEAELLSVKGLTCELQTPAGTVRPVEDLSFVLGHGKTLGLVGESGAGKSMLARALLPVVPPDREVLGGGFLYWPPT